MNRDIKNSYVILIDTNAVTALSLYIEACELVGKDPSKISSLEELKNELENRVDKEEWLAFEDRCGIKAGFRAFKYLKSKTEEYELVIFFPFLVELETLHLLTERKFDQVLTQRGVPYRLRTKKVFRIHLDFDYNQIYEKWHSFKNKLEDCEIILRPAEKEHKEFWNELFSISNVLMKYILLETMDAIIYASALLLRVDEVYTYDTELKRIINNIHNQSIPQWRLVAEQLCQDLKRNVPSIREEEQSATERGIKDYKIKLPRGEP